MKGEIVIIPDFKYYISIIGVFCFILIAAYTITKLIAKNSSTFIKGRNIKVIEKIALGIDKSMYLINVGTAYYIIAVGKQNIELIDKISEESLKFNLNNTQYKKSEEASINIESFKTSIINKLKEMKRKNEVEYYTDEEEKKW